MVITVQVDYKIMPVTNKSVNEPTRYGMTAEKNGARREVPALQPGGTPNVTAAKGCNEVDVVTIPEPSVMMKVAIVGVGEIVGSADTLKILWPRTGTYVLVARPDGAMPPIGAVTEELSAYGGVVYVGVGRMKLGSVVATVADIDDKKEEMESGESEEVAFWREYNPIIGGSFELIPKLVGSREPQIGSFRLPGGLPENRIHCP